MERPVFPFRSNDHDHPLPRHHHHHHHHQQQQQLQRQMIVPTTDESTNHDDDDDETLFLHHHHHHDIHFDLLHDRTATSVEDDDDDEDLMHTPPSSTPPPPPSSFFGSASDVQVPPSSSRPLSSSASSSPFRGSPTNVQVPSASPSSSSASSSPFRGSPTHVQMPSSSSASSSPFRGSPTHVQVPSASPSSSSASSSFRGSHSDAQVPSSSPTSPSASSSPFPGSPSDAQVPSSASPPPTPSSASAIQRLPAELYQDNNPGPLEAPSPPLPPPFRNGCTDVWRWSRVDRSHEVRLVGADLATAFFHPNWSNGTAGVRGTRPINHGVHYWEIRVPGRIFGTSMMFGVATRRARLHADSFVNLLGEDGESWALSHRGLAWHGGQSSVFCPPFKENTPVTVGMVYDGDRGTLAYYKNGESLGVAFTGVHSRPHPPHPHHQDEEGDDLELYPAVCSTAAKTEMMLGVRRRGFQSLQDRCRCALVRRLEEVGRLGEVGGLPLPRVLCQYVWEEAQAVDALPVPDRLPPRGYGCHGDV